MHTRGLVLILFFASVTAYSLAELPAIHPGDQSIVTTDRGLVRGMVTTTLRMYLGIPYAAPPVGRLRWRPPQPHARWFTPLDATKFGSSCPQGASPFGFASLNENRLFLNVFTPDDESAGKGDRRPVMVWIHGGAFILGDSNDYVPSRMVGQGDVIAVTLNYRLGALGFLAHPALSAESPDHISGNYGIMDQQFALAWIQRNIASFGGDPDNVTIFGWSAGGFSVFSHMASPPAASLFHRAIVQSGAYELTLPTLAYSELQGVGFADSLGCSNQTADCLRARSVRRILNDPYGLDIGPIVDGKILPQSLDTAFATGQFHHVPLIQGSTHDEWRLFVALDFDLSGGPITPEQYPSVVESMVGTEFAPLVLAQYPLSNYASSDLAVGALGTDSIFACPARAADQILFSQVPTFSYEFNDINALEIFLPPVSFRYGATHGSELRYLFRLSQGGQLDGGQKDLSDAMVHYWTQFAKSGDPNSSGTASWPQYDATADEFQSLLPPSPVTEFEFARDHKCDFWEKLLGTSSQVAARVENKPRRISTF